MTKVLIVLDLDDTLYLERDYVRSGFQAVDKWLKIHRFFDDFFEEAWSLFNNGERRTIFNMVLERRGLFDAYLVKELIEVYRKHIPLITLEQDAGEFLLNHHKNELALITDGPADSQWSKIKVLNIEKHIGTIVVTDDLGPTYSKPNIEAFKIVQGSLPGSACVYIADNPLKDFFAPAMLGWLPSIRIRRVGSLREDVPTPDDCIEVQSFRDIGDKLRQ